MGWLGRARRRVKRWFTEPPSPPPPPPEPPEPPDEPPPRDLPPGWSFQGLYYGDRDPSDRKVINKDPSNGDIALADGVVVSYTDGLGTIYRTVHGANSRRGVGRLIMRTIMIVSPPR